jgi:hypothetical protein
MSNNEDSKTADPSAADEATASSLLAKWLIPSVAILFGVVGYVVQTAQESLLGVQSAAHEGSAYLNSAADFVRDAVVQLLSSPLHFASHRPWLLLFSVIVTALAIVATSSRRLRTRFGRRRVVAVAAFAILLVVGVKFLMMDAPLLKIQNLANSSDNACWTLIAQENSRPLPCPAKMAAKGAEALVWSESSQIAGEIVCSRIEDAKALPEAISRSVACQPPKKGQNQQQKMVQNKTALTDEFICNLVIEIVTIAAALVVFRRAGHNFGATMACLLVLFYGLSAPYAYGKVGMTQLFDAGDARIRPDLKASYTAEDPKMIMGEDRLKGIILEKDAGGVSILVMREGGCPLNPDGTPAPSQVRASSSYLSRDQLLSFDQLEKVDLILWLASQQRNCPG